MLCSLVAVALFAQAGCAAFAHLSGNPVKEYSDPAQTIVLRAGEEFVIALPSNPSTGYTWDYTVDAGLVQFVSREFRSQATATPVVGTGGTDYLLFRAIKAGEAEITMVYHRPWETSTPVPPQDHKVFAVRISG